MRKGECCKKVLRSHHIKIFNVQALKRGLLHEKCYKPHYLIFGKRIAVSLRLHLEENLSYVCNSLCSLSQDRAGDCKQQKLMKLFVLALT